MPLPVQPSQRITIDVDSHAAGVPLDHFWSRVVGAGRANEGLRSTWQEELATAHQYGGFQYVRFHGLFHDDMFVYREDEHGNPVYNFQYVDDLFDRIQGKGMKPFVELGFVPKELATTENTTFWWQANGSPPKDYDKWVAMVQAIVRHWIARYGEDTVRTWYFEVWNEPNLYKQFFRGTQAQYFELYRRTSLAIKEIDRGLRVGGPATSNFVLDQDAVAKAKSSGKPYDPLSLPWKPMWIDDFLRYCHSNHLPVDFVSTHPYPQDFAIEDAGMVNGGKFRRSIDSTRDDLRTLRALVNASDYPHAEIQLTEWSSSPSPLDHTHDSLAAAAFIAKTNLDSVGLVDSLSYWVFTDVFEENRKTDSVFHGGFGLINYQQIVKPAFHAYRMLNLLGDQVLRREDGAVVTRDTKSRRISALVYNYPAEEKISLPKTDSLAAADAIDASGSSRMMDLKITGLAANASFLVETLDRDHGNAVAAWEAMGKPEPPTPTQTEALRKAAWGTTKEFIRADSHGVLSLNRLVKAWSLVSIRQQ